MSARKFRKEEIFDQLDDLGAYRRDLEAERAVAKEALERARNEVRSSLSKAIDEAERFAELEASIDEGLARVFQSTALWAHRAAETGIPETEVLRRLELAKQPNPPEDWEYET